MALIKCRECGKRISKTANSCPGCGSLMFSRTKKLEAAIIFVFGSVFFFFLFMYLYRNPQASPEIIRWLFDVLPFG